MTIWVRRLTVWELLRWTVALQRGATLVFDEPAATLSAKKLARAYRERGLAVLSDLFDFNQKDANGHAILYKMQETLLASMGAFVDERLAGEPRWLRDSVHFRLRESVDDPLSFATWAEHRGARAGRDVLVLSGPPPLESIAPHFRARGWDLRLRRRGRLKALLRPFQLGVAALFTPFLYTSSARAGKDGSVWVEYCDPGVFDHAFWRKGLPPRPEKLVYYLDRPDTPPAPDRLARIAADGFSAFDLRGARAFAHAAIGPDGVARAAWASAGAAPCWLRAVVFECRVWREVYEALYRRFDVRLLVQHQDRGWKPALQADAIEKAGGIMIGYHWSNIPYCPPRWWLLAQHVYFTWGASQREAIDRIGHAVGHIIPSGLWLDAADSQSREAAALRSRSEFTLCLFDSSVAYSLWQSPRTLSEFYRRMLALVERHPRWGLILKCKELERGHEADLLPDHAMISESIERLRKADRLLSLPASTSPIAAASSADLSVCYTVNSAGAIAGMRGSRAIHWDCVGLRNPILRNPGQKIMFSTLDDVEAAVEAAGKGDKAIGDLSRWLPDFDSFRDRLAAERVGAFVGDYLALRESTDARTACAEAVSIYKRKNQIGESFYRRRLWGESD